MKHPDEADCDAVWQEWHGRSSTSDALADALVIASRDLANCIGEGGEVPISEWWEHLARAAREHLASEQRVLARDYNILLDALKTAVRVIEGLEDQQAMPDDWYVLDLAYLRGLVTYVKPIEEE